MNVQELDERNEVVLVPCENLLYILKEKNIDPFNCTCQDYIEGAKQLVKKELEYWQPEIIDAYYTTFRELGADHLTHKHPDKEVIAVYFRRTNKKTPDEKLQEQPLNANPI